jgi:renalase
VLGSSVDPAASFAHRWSFARPSRPHPEPYLLTESVGICGDGWGGRSSVGAAWTSGHALAGAVAARVG